MQFTYCPDPACGALAEIVDRFAMSSTDGAIEHAKVVCLHRHWFMLPVEALATGVDTVLTARDPATPDGTHRTPR